LRRNFAELSENLQFKIYENLKNLTNIWKLVQRSARFQRFNCTIE